MTSEYEKEFSIFCRNVNSAARSFYYHTGIQNKIYDDGVKHQNLPDGYFQNSPVFQAINENAQFWNDYKYSSILYVIITLGRVFDDSKKSHSIRRLIRVAKNSGLFTRKELRKRKIESSDNSHEWIDSYMSNVSEISTSDYYRFLRYNVDTLRMWKKVKGIRNKIYAHEDVMTEEKRNKILKKGEYTILSNIINRLLIVENILCQSFHNGRKPDYSYINQGLHERVEKDMDLLLSKLI